MITKTTNDKVKNTVLMILLISCCFLMTGSGYLSWLYNLMSAKTSQVLSNNRIVDNIFLNTDLLSEVIGYLFQALGLFISVYLVDKEADSRMFAKVVACDLLFTVLGMLLHNFAFVLVMGYCMNVLHGIVAGYYLMYLTKYVPHNRVGTVFGMGYAVGSIGTWIISLINGGEFLKHTGVVSIYFVLAVISIYIVHIISLENENINNYSEGIISLNGNNTSQQANFNLILISGIVVVLLSLSKGVGFYFPMADISSGNISLEFVRIFYALGLIVAGIVNDFDYRWGRALCVAGLVLPFVLIMLRQNQTSSIYLWIISYAFTGLYTVYRIVVMAGYGYYRCGTSKLLIPVIILGLLFGRIGDSFGALIGIALSDYPVTLIIAGAIIYVITVITVFAEIRMNGIAPVETVSENEKKDSGIIHVSDVSDESNDLRINLKREYQISDREYDVLILMLKGYTNSRIASELYISENTVKFHVKNILKKTGCSNRKEISTGLLQ